MPTPTIEELIEASSLGTEGARRLRDSTSPAIVDRIMRCSREENDAFGACDREDQIMAKRGNQHVVPHEQGWAVRTEQASRVSSVHRTQAEAIRVAREHAREQGTELLVHGRDGRIRERDSHGNDESPPEG